MKLFVTGLSVQLDHDAMQERRNISIFPKLDMLELGVLLLCFCIYMFWTLSFTTWNYGPDEYMRFDVPKFIVTNHALPKGPEESIRNQIWGVSYGFDIALPYLLEASAMWVVSQFTQEHIPLLIAARMVSVVSTLCTVYFAILFSKKTMGKNPMRWSFVLMMALLPQIVFLASYVNLDSFSLFAVMIILYGWIVCMEREWDNRSSMLLAVGLGLCLASSQFAYSYVLASVFLYITWHLINWKYRNFKLFITTGILILGIAFVICGWRYIRNAMLFDGDFLALNASKPYAEMYAMEEYKPSVRMTLEKSGMSMISMLRETSWILSSWRSLIGVFGYMNIPLPDSYYAIYKYMIIAGFVGILVKAVAKFLRSSKRGKFKNSMLFSVWIAFASLVTIYLSAYNSWHTDYQPQGRYIITITPLLFLAVANGMDFWINLISFKTFGKEEITLNFKYLCVLIVFGFMLLSVFLGFYCCMSSFVYSR